MDRLARVNRARRVGKKANEQRREPIGQGQKQHRKCQVEGGVEIRFQVAIDMLHSTSTLRLGSMP
jgi:hypothetical protein